MSAPFNPWAKLPMRGVHVSCYYLRLGHARSSLSLLISLLTVSMQFDTVKLHYLLHAATLVEEKLRHRLSEIGISPRQARVIDALARIGAVSQITLAREFAITPASMSTMTGRLIAADIITRKVDPTEVRSNIVELTPRGRALLADVHAAWRDIDTLIAETLGAKDAAAYATLNRRLRDRLGGKVPGLASDNTPQVTRQETRR